MTNGLVLVRSLGGGFGTAALKPLSIWCMSSYNIFFNRFCWITIFRNETSVHWGFLTVEKVINLLPVSTAVTGEPSWPRPAEDTLAPCDPVATCALPVPRGLEGQVQMFALALTRLQEIRPLLFIYLSSIFPPSPSPQEQPSFFDACSFFLSPLPPPPRSLRILPEMWAEVTAEAAEMTGSGCLQGHLSASSCSFITRPPLWSSLVPACSCYCCHTQTSP